MIADVICYWKMTSFTALDSVTSFLHLNDVTNTCKRMRRGVVLAGVLRCKSGKLEEAEDFCFLRLLCNKIEIDQLQCVICWVLDNYDGIISDTLEKQNRDGKKPTCLILVTNIHRQARASQ